MTRTLRLRLTAIVTVIAMLMVAIPAQALATDVLGESIGLIEIPLAPSNMTISKEVAMFDSVIDNLWTARETLYDNPAVVGAPYVPLGATCLEVYSVGNVVYVNYIMNNTYYYTTYYKNTGEVEKVARVKNSDDIYSVSTANTTASVVRNLDEWRSTYTYSAETDSFILVEQSIGRQNMNSRSLIFGDKIMPISYDSVYNDGEYMVEEGTVNIPELAGFSAFPSGVSTSMYYRIYEKSFLSSPLPNNHTVQDFDAETSVSQIASTFGASVFYIRSMLTSKGVNINTSDCITQYIEIIETWNEIYNANVVCIIYCPIKTYYVLVYDASDDAEINLSTVGNLNFYWTNLSETGLGYNEPVWVSSCELFEDISLTDVVEKGAERYSMLVETGLVSQVDPYVFGSM